MNEPLVTEIFETIPLIMHNLRKEVRSQKDPPLTMEEFRLMLFVVKNKGSNLSNAADRIGLSLSSVSKIVDTLLKKDFVTCQASAEDRRHITLSLTTKGRLSLQSSLDSAKVYLSTVVDKLAPSLQKEIGQSLQILRTAFSQPPPKASRR